MESRNKLYRILKFFVEWPVYMTGLLIIMNIVVLIKDPDATGTTLIFTGLYAAVSVAVYFIKRKTVSQELVRFGVNFGTVQRKLQSELSLPYAVLDSEGHVLWSNAEFNGLFTDGIKTRQAIYELIPELSKDIYPQGETASQVCFAYAQKSFRAELKRIPVESFVEDSYWNTDKRLPSDKHSNELISLYLYDETLITKLQKDIVDQETIIGLLYIDNYDEAIESTDEVRHSILTALIERKITKYFQSFDTIIKKIEKDKYVLVFQNQHLQQLKAAKFPILDEIRSVSIGNDISVTLSIGIGVGCETFVRGYDAARAAIDLALGRGGDQVVIKGPDAVEYYGGKSGSVEKNTKVKSRVKAQALRELIEAKDKVLIMGHSNGDPDSFGASVGVFRIASSLNKEAHIVLDKIPGSLSNMADNFKDNSDYANMIISSEQALSTLDAMTLTVVVDVSRISHMECPELIERAKTTVVLDHHRRGDDSMENSALSYIETAASSACEIVAEIIQYIGDDVKLRPVEADAMYAGIMIDSSNFVTKTGVRTFEAAAFLRRNGADVVRIRKAFRTDLNEYTIKAKAIATAEKYLDSFALAVFDADPKYVDTENANPTVLGAQVANELMNISDVKASFVFTEYKDQIFVSARSIDEVNVQIIMEKLGGGGHMSAAGTQFTECTIEEAIERVKDTLKAMRDGGEL